MRLKALNLSGDKNSLLKNIPELLFLLTQKKLAPIDMLETFNPLEFLEILKPIASKGNLLYEIHTILHEPQVIPPNAIWLAWVKNNNSLEIERLQGVLLDELSK